MRNTTINLIDHYVGLLEDRDLDLGFITREEIAALLKVYRERLAAEDTATASAATRAVQDNLDLVLAALTPEQKDRLLREVLLGFKSGRLEVR